ncbi:nicotinate (nicotinamide) nucleotide adenylyltransferase [Undibacterium sp. TS12]|uniref:nicotinate (nicotinamide) nucleotide adenylyltransferase n=1 Tax=Undibacterium sp. TS12 TaxID=2908202 RepID=UPI001F4CF9DA|nr:nicotinate (nicotinamide) nucleotide adenylyltransferase [Undibacterium sp. TS12]MCH8619867.1 nicotinate (nicotinamide) nucleotide adenylyltransferase [Undibacterium sp. TS12]
MGIETRANRCILILGGSFDPVHQGHIALAESLALALKPDQLRIIPVGQQWQKSEFQASPQQRLAMLKLAFEDWQLCPVVFDEQEIDRAAQGKANYTIDTLRQLRQELGADASLVFAMGADQLQNLHTWHNWQGLLDVAHLCAASRPGFSLDISSPGIADIWKQSSLSAEEIRSRPAGGTYLERNLAQDVSATQLRTELKQHNPTTRLLVPHKVLDYLTQQTIYQ